eukprot:11137265-Heterocapsa_arctica.AAC.1
MDEGDLAFPHISGEQTDDDDPKTTDCPEVGQIIKHNKQHKCHNDHLVDSKKNLYPGFSSQTRVKLRAEQLFKEGQADKAIKQQEALQNKQRKKAEKEQ